MTLDVSTAGYVLDDRDAFDDVPRLVLIVVPGGLVIRFPWAP